MKGWRKLKSSVLCHARSPHYPLESELDVFIVSECVRSRILEGHGSVTHWGP